MNVSAASRETAALKLMTKNHFPIRIRDERGAGPDGIFSNGRLVLDDGGGLRFRR